MPWLRSLPDWRALVLRRATRMLRTVLDGGRAMQGIIDALALALALAAASSQAGSKSYSHYLAMLR